MPLEFQQGGSLLLQSVPKALRVPQDPRKCGMAKRTGQLSWGGNPESASLLTSSSYRCMEASETPPRSSLSEMTETAVVLRVRRESCCNPKKLPTQVSLGTAQP